MWRWNQRESRQREVVRLYIEEHLTCQEIGDQFGVSRAAIEQMLRRAGVKSEQGKWVATACA